jgi:LemA protein
LRIALIAIPVLLAATAVAGSTFVRVRSDLIQQRAAIASGWSDVDQALQERARLIADLAEDSQKSTPLEPELRKEIVDSHAAVVNGPAPPDKIQANDRLSNALAKVLVSAENYRQLRSEPAFLRLQEEIKKSEDRIAVARLKYNDSLEHYNARIQTFPNNFVAKILGFGRNDAYFPTEHF